MNTPADLPAAAETKPPERSDAGPSPRGTLVVAVVVALGLLTWNLGFYPFWGDEADTVIFARGVWETGDTSALYGENLYAYRNGTLLENLKNRSAPPAAYYFLAPIWGAFGDDHFALRLPFALCQAAIVVVAGVWLVRVGAGRWLAAAVLIGLALNVSFLLYGRQCRYYALAGLLTAGGAYAYWFFDGSRRRLAQLTVCLCLLAATHYLHFAAAVGALVVDYALWGRLRTRLTARQWSAVIVPTLAVVVWMAVVYNPIGKHNLIDPAIAATKAGNPLLEKAKLVWWSLRDVNTCEFGVGLLLAVAPWLFVWQRRWGALRLWGACLTYVVVTALLSPQPVGITLVADVRYLAPLIPALVALTMLAVDGVCGRRRRLLVALAGLCVFTNVAHRPWDPDSWRSTLGEFVHELRSPRRTGGAELAAWLKEHARPGDTAWLLPNEWTAEQIVEAPHVVYGWQLDQPKREADFAALPRIHFIGEVPVDWIIALGYGNTDALAVDHVKRRVLPSMADRGFQYRQAAHLPIYFDDNTRPELVWHWFRDQPYDKTNRGITIFQLQRP